MKVIAFDTEILERLGKNDPRFRTSEELTMTCFCMTDGTEQYVYITDDSVTKFLTPRLQGVTIVHDLNYLASRINQADLIISFNGNAFDLPLIYGNAPKISEALTARPHYDLLNAFGDVAFHRISLDNMAKALDLSGKTMSGDYAPKLWATAKRHLDFAELWRNRKPDARIRDMIACGIPSAHMLFKTVIDYCIADCQLTLDCFRKLALGDGILEYPDRSGNRRMVQLKMPDAFLNYSSEDVTDWLTKGGTI